MGEPHPAEEREAGKLILETPRLALRELHPSDIGFLSSVLADPEVMRFWPRPYSREEAEAWMRDQMDRYERHGHGYWLAVEKATGRPVGLAGLLTLEIGGKEEPALGYIMHRPFWRRGFATEAAAAIRDFTFETLGRNRVTATIRPENTPSQGVALKLGMKPEEDITYMAAGFDHLVFSVSRSVV
jgi:[ribosomal protein S5]-alanine N-acetyltransferase